MNYETSGNWARAIALLVAILVGLSYGFHLFNMTANIYTAVGFGLLFTAVLAGVWHVLLHYTQTARRWPSRAALLVFGVFMTAGSIVVSGRAVTTMIGGEAALSSAQHEILPEFEAALSAAYSNVQGQDAIVARVLEAATQMRLNAREEGNTGEGPRFRSYYDAAQMFQTRADQISDELAKGKAIYDRGSDALSGARQAIGDEEAFDLAISQTQAAIRELNAINATGAVLKSGTVISTNDGTLSRLDEVTRGLHADVERQEPTPVGVPTYSAVTATDAIAPGEGNIGYWFTSAFIESVPLIMLVLLMLMWREPLMREPANPRVRSDDEIRRNEENVIGLTPRAAE